MNTPEHCEGCSIPLSQQMPEDATSDEMLCDSCYDYDEDE